MTPTRAAITVALILAPIYAVSCWWWPFADCLCCKGKGRHHREDRKVHRLCRWCRGSGRRLRIGRRIYNYFARAHRNAS